MTQFMTEVLMSVKAEAGKLEFNPVVVARKQFSNDLLEDLPLKENNLPQLCNALCPTEDKRFWLEELGIGKTRRERETIESLLVSLVLLPALRASARYKMCRGLPKGIC